MMAFTNGCFAQGVFSIGAHVEFGSLELANISCYTINRRLSLGAQQGKIDGEGGCKVGFPNISESQLLVGESRRDL